MEDGLIDLLKVVLVAVIGAVSTYLLYRRQSRDDQSKKEAETIHLKMETWQMLVNELQEERGELKSELMRQKSERDIIIKRIENYITRIEALETEREEDKARIVELEKENRTLNDLVSQLQRRLREVEKKTGPLPPLDG